MIDLFLARLFYPETFPRSTLFAGAPVCGALVLAVGLTTLAAVVLS
jgi:hypothetical protein